MRCRRRPSATARVQERPTARVSTQVMASQDVGVSSEFLEAFYLFVREAAARTYEHLGIPDGLARVPPETLDDATLTILVSMARRSGGLDAVSFDEARQEILARAFEEYWRLVIGPAFRFSDRRGDVLEWMRGQAGRPVGTGRL